MRGRDGLSHPGWFDGMGGGCVRGVVEINVSLSKKICILYLF